jgi:tetratricopeptide (TPR) repeat protein
VPENPRIEELRRRVQADPASIAFAALAEEFRRTGRFEDAIETCRTGLQRHPAYLSARVTLGRALLETGDYQAAREELETVLRSAPENLAAIRGLEQINERLGHSTEMHADLHEMMREPIRLAAERPPAPPPAPAEPPALDLALTAPPDAPRAAQALGSFDLSRPDPESPPAPAPEAAEAAESTGTPAWEPFDIFAAALQPAAAPPPPAPVPVMTCEASTIAFEAPAVPAPPPHTSMGETFAAPALEPASDSVEDLEAAPAPHVAAMVTRLERFLGAIESARHA